MKKNKTIILVAILIVTGFVALLLFGKLSQKELLTTGINFVIAISGSFCGFLLALFEERRKKNKILNEIKEKWLRLLSRELGEIVSSGSLKRNSIHVINPVMMKLLFSSKDIISFVGEDYFEKMVTIHNSFLWLDNNNVSINKDKLKSELLEDITGFLKKMGKK